MAIQYETLNAQHESGFPKQISVNRPDRCPYPDCRKIQELRLESASVSDNPTLFALYRCTSQTCGKVFAVSFAQRQQFRTTEGNSVEGWFPDKTLPADVYASDLPNIAGDISPEFKMIYEESKAAEAQGLNRICGGGYRRALEFLVKDYCIKLQPEQKDKIEGKMLGAVIEDHIDEKRIKEMAKRAAWLGNDEVHYLRKWESKDLADLKTLILLTANFMEMERLAKVYEGEMPAGR